MKNPWHEPRQRKLQDISIQNASSFTAPNEKYLNGLVPRKRREKLTGLNHVYKCPLQHCTFPMIIT